MMFNGLKSKLLNGLGCNTADMTFGCLARFIKKRKRILIVASLVGKKRNSNFPLKKSLQKTMAQWLRHRSP